MRLLKTALQFTANVTTTGAVYQTSKRAGQEVSKFVTGDHPQIIVEYGAGLGNISRIILDKMHPASKLYLFEVNEAFCAVLKQLDDPRLVVVNDSAERVGQYVQEPIDCIISTIPFTLIAKPVLTRIISQSRRQLKETGVMSQILYSTYHLRYYKAQFGQVFHKMILSLPPEFVYHCCR